MKVVLNRKKWAQARFLDCCAAHGIRGNGIDGGELGVLGLFFAFRQVWYDHENDLFWVQPNVLAWRTLVDTGECFTDKREVERLYFNNLGWVVRIHPETPDDDCCFEHLGDCAFGDFKTPGMTYNLMGIRKVYC
jgi:hypothetical protein